MRKASLGGLCWQVSEVSPALAGSDFGLLWMAQGRVTRKGCPGDPRVPCQKVTGACKLRLHRFAVPRGPEYDGFLHRGCERIPKPWLGLADEVCALGGDVPEPRHRLCPRWTDYDFGLPHTSWCSYRFEEGCMVIMATIGLLRRIKSPLFDEKAVKQCLSALC